MSVDDDDDDSSGHNKKDHYIQVHSKGSGEDTRRQSRVNMLGSVDDKKDTTNNNGQKMRGKRIW